MLHIVMMTMVMMTMTMTMILNNDSDSDSDREHRNHISDDGDGYHDADVVDVVVDDGLFQDAEAPGRGLQAWNSLQSRQS